MLRFISLPFWLFVFQFLPIAAQNQHFYHYTEGENVFDVAFGSGNAFWAATSGGLAFFEGASHPPQFFNRGNTALPVNYIRSVSVGPDGALWLGTEIGLVRWKDGVAETYNPPSANPWQTLQLFCLAVNATPEGKVWVMASQGPIWLFDNGTWKQFPKSTFGENVSVSSFKMLPNGHLWIYGRQGSENLFFHFDGQLVTPVPLPAWLPYTPGSPVYEWDVDPSTEGIAFIRGKYVCSYDGTQWQVEDTGFWGHYIAVAPDGRIFMYNEYDGLCSRAPGEPNWTKVQTNPIGSFDCEKMLVGPDGKPLLMGERGLYHFDGSQVVKLRTSQSGIPNNSVAHLAVTGQQTVWGSFDEDIDPYWHSGKELACFTDGAWHSLSDSVAELQYKHVKGLAVDAFDRLWAATFSHGLLRWDGAAWANFPTPEMPWGIVSSISARPSSTEIWVGGHDKVGRLRPDNTLEVFDVPVHGGYLTTICADLDGGLWVPTIDGVARFFEQTWASFSSEDMGMFYAGWIHKIACAPDGKIWVLAEYGVSVYDGSQWAAVSESLPFLNRTYSAIAFDGDQVWLGQYDFACFAPTTLLYLIKYENNLFTLYPYISTPLPYPNITALAVDKHHNLWIGTEKGGLAVFNELGVTLGTNSSNVLSSPPLLKAFAAPNPIENILRIVFELPRDADVSLEVFNVSGKCVHVSRRNAMPQGQHIFDTPRLGLSPGFYTWCLTSEVGRASGKVFVSP